MLSPARPRTCRWSFPGIDAPKTGGNQRPPLKSSGEPPIDARNLPSPGKSPTSWSSSPRWSRPRSQPRGTQDAGAKRNAPRACFGANRGAPKGVVPTRGRLRALRARRTTGLTTRPLGAECAGPPFEPSPAGLDNGPSVEAPSSLAEGMPSLERRRTVSPPTRLQSGRRRLRARVAGAAAERRST
jgi:hypothetical protein